MNLTLRVCLYRGKTCFLFFGFLGGGGGVLFIKLHIKLRLFQLFFFFGQKMNFSTTKKNHFLQKLLISAFIQKLKTVFFFFF